MLMVLLVLAELAAAAYWIVNFATGQKIGPPIDLPFFMLLFGSGLASACAKLIRDRIEGPSSYMYLPGWLLNPKAQLIFLVVNLPIYWSNMAVWIYGFFILPWYTVLISSGIDTIVGGLFHGTFLNRFPMVLALLISYLIMLTTFVWYFGFFRR